MDENKLTLTVDELAAQLGISRPIAYRLAHSDDFPAIVVGKRILIPRAGLEAWLVEQSARPRA